MPVVSVPVCVMQVMHSDLKTKNVLLTKDQVTAKIADVGLSQFLDHQTNQPNIIACECLLLPMHSRHDCTWRIFSLCLKHTYRCGA